MRHPCPGRFLPLSAVFLALAFAGCASAPPAGRLASAVSPDAASATLTPPEQSLRDRVRALLVERMGERAARIEVRVEGTNLWLTGRAPNDWERDRAHDLAHEVAGVTRVDSSGIGIE